MSSVNGIRSVCSLRRALRYQRRRFLPCVLLPSRTIAGSLGLVISVVAWLLPTPASCADIFVAAPSWTIYLKGEIQTGDAGKFSEIIDRKITEYREKKPNTQLVMIVRPTSFGGSVAESMEIGRLIRKNALWVSTNAPGQRCANACVLILAAGVNKLPGPGTIGIHRPTFPSNSFSALSSQQALERYGAMSKDVRSYLAEMDIPPKLFNEMIQIDKVKWLTWDQLSAYGLVGETAAYAEWKHAQAVEDRKRLRSP